MTTVHQFRDAIPIVGHPHIFAALTTYIQNNIIDTTHLYSFSSSAYFSLYSIRELLIVYTCLYYVVFDLILLAKCSFPSLLTNQIRYLTHSKSETGYYLKLDNTLRKGFKRLDLHFDDLERYNTHSKRD